MPIPHRWLVFGALLLLPTAVHASDHRAGIFVAPSNEYPSLLWGFYASGEVTVPKPNNKDVNVLVDVGVYSGSHDDRDFTHISLMGGVGWTLFSPRETQPHLFSVHGLVGILSSDDEINIEDGIDPAGALGVAWEFVPGRAEKKEGLGVRAQFDVVLRGDGSFPRLSVGAVYRFKT